MTSVQRSPIPDWRIILLPTVICIVLGLVISWRLSLYTPDIPIQIAPPPSQAETILGVRPGLGVDALFIQSIDGKTYEKSYKGWDARFATPEQLPGEECGALQIQTIEAVAGRIDHCKQVQLLGEWCPGPLVSYAITSKGDIWQLRSTTQCGSFLAIPIILVLTFLGLFIGVIIIIMRRLFLRPSR